MAQRRLQSAVPLLWWGGSLIRTAILPTWKVRFLTVLLMSPEKWVVISKQYLPALPAHRAIVVFRSRVASDCRRVVMPTPLLIAFVPTDTLRFLRGGETTGSRFWR